MAHGKIRAEGLEFREKGLETYTGDNGKPELLLSYALELSIVLDLGLRLRV